MKHRAMNNRPGRCVIMIGRIKNRRSHLPWGFQVVIAPVGATISCGPHPSEAVIAAREEVSARSIASLCSTFIEVAGTADELSSPKAEGCA